MAALIDIRIRATVIFDVFPMAGGGEKTSEHSVVRSTRPSA